MKTQVAVVILLLVARTKYEVVPPSLIIRVKTDPINFSSIFDELDKIAVELGLPKNDRSKTASLSMEREVLFVDYDDGIGLVPIKIRAGTFFEPNILEIAIFEICNPHCTVSERLKQEVVPNLLSIGEITYGNPDLQMFGGL